MTKAALAPLRALLTTVFAAFLTASLPQASAAPIFPEDGSATTRKWWVSPDAEQSLIAFPELKTLLHGYGIELRISQFQYSFLQDVLLFDVEGNALLQPDMRSGDPAALRDLTLGIYNSEERRLTRYDEGSATTDRQAHQSLRGTLVEGGALITGRKADGSTYAITPIETLRRTQIFLQLPEAQARQTIADDLGISPENLITLSPTDGHVDRAIQAFPGGVVLVHDPSTAVEFLREARADPAATRGEKALLDEMIAESAASPNSALQTIFDSNAAAIRAAGLKVIRVAGRFSVPQPWLSTRRSFERINFLNGTVMRGPRDQLVVLTNRAEGLPSLERLWAKKLSALTRILARDVHFLGSYAFGAGLDCVGAISP